MYYNYDIDENLIALANKVEEKIKGEFIVYCALIRVIFAPIVDKSRSILS